MTTENPQNIAYQHLAALAQEHARIVDKPEEIQNLVRTFARAILSAIHLGLTPDEIRAACREGRGTNTQVIIDPSLDPEYWLRVYAEAESFWVSRSGYEDDRLILIEKSLR
ncbi:MAG: hypothetical protein K8L91_15830 [Anaerolineae bacterium]|nr:hypothetical protein [Anaerolineae bacterium]